MRNAAEELFVTPGAISQQVRALEQHLGVVLFDRSARAIRLTSAGQEFYVAANRHLRGIALAAEQLKPRDQTISITVAPDFASRWLMPRLRGFALLNPLVEVRVDASFTVADFDRDPFDLAIRTAKQAPEGLHAELLLEQSVKPYCSTSYFDRTFRKSPRSKAWARARLLHESRPYDLWSPWFAARGLSERNAEVGLYFSHGLLAILAAIDSEGVTLQPPSYVEREIVQGSLVEADSLEMTTGLGYYLVWPERPLRPAGERFRSWISEVARTTRESKGSIS